MMSEQTILQLAREIAAVGAKVDMLMSKLDERAAQQDKKIDQMSDAQTKLERRVDQLEKWQVKLLAGFAVIAALVGLAFKVAGFLIPK